MKRVIIIISIIGVIIVGGYIFVNGQYMVTNDKSAIISFAGSLLGAVLSGLITFIALYFTIQHEKKQFEKEKAIQIMPYLSFTKQTNSKHSNYNSSCGNFLVGENVASCYIFREETHFLASNVGLGTAVKISMTHIGDAIPFQCEQKVEDICVRAGEQISYGIIFSYYADIHETFFPTIDIPAILLRCTYENMFGDKYEQEVEIITSGNAVNGYFSDVNKATAPKRIR